MHYLIYTSFRAKMDPNTVPELQRGPSSGRGCTWVAFHKNSPLKAFLQKKTNVVKVFYTPTEILNTLRDIIWKEGLYDPGNPGMVLCSEELEEALNQKALHASEMIGTVIKQIAWVRDPKPKKPTGKSPIPGGLGTVQSLPSNPRDSRILIPAHQIVKVKPDLLGVIRSLEGVSQHKTIYTFPQVVSLVHKYIKSKRDELIDPRNLKVVLVRNDPLGDAFHVQAFHLMQLNTFTVKQLFFTFPRRLKRGGNIRKKRLAARKEQN